MARPDRGEHGEHDRDRRDEHRREAESRCPRKRFDVVGGAATRSPVPARSSVDSGNRHARSTNRSRRSANRLSPNTKLTRPRPPRHERLNRDREQQQSDDGVDMASRRPGRQGVDEVTDQPRRDQPRQRRERVEDDDRTEVAAVVAKAAAACAPDLRRLGDGQVRRSGSVSASVGSVNHPRLGAGGDAAAGVTGSSSVVISRHLLGSRCLGMPHGRPRSSACVPLRHGPPVLEQDHAIGVVEDERAHRRDDGRPAAPRLGECRADAPPCASTALVGSSRTSTGGSAASAWRA